MICYLWMCKSCFKFIKKVPLDKLLKCLFWSLFANFNRLGQGKDVEFRDWPAT